MAELPQLAMRREGLDGLKRVRPEFGYLVRTYRPGDDALWCAIMESGVGGGWTPARFREMLFDDPRFDPRGLFFVTIGSRAVGTACAWRATPDETRAGILDMTVVSAAHQGRGLGKFLTFKVLEYFQSRGFSECTLTTDDWRTSAIRCYLSLGFRPHFTDGSHPMRWDAVFRYLGRPMPDPV